MKLYFDFEFTGLRQDTTPISFGIVSENDDSFYFEFADYDRTQLTRWIRTNVLPELVFKEVMLEDEATAMNLVEGMRSEEPPINLAIETEAGGQVTAGGIGTIKDCGQLLCCWLGEVVADADEACVLYGDVPSYDAVLFDRLRPVLEEHSVLDYIVRDLATALELADYDPDLERVVFVGYEGRGTRHNALEDARVIKACCERLAAEANRAGVAQEVEQVGGVLEAIKELQDIARQMKETLSAADATVTETGCSTVPETNGLWPRVRRWGRKRGLWR